MVRVAVLVFSFFLSIHSVCAATHLRMVEDPKRGDSFFQRPPPGLSNCLDILEQMHFVRARSLFLVDPGDQLMPIAEPYFEMGAEYFKPFGKDYRLAVRVRARGQIPAGSSSHRAPNYRVRTYGRISNILPIARYDEWITEIRQNPNQLNAHLAQAEAALHEYLFALQIGEHEIRTENNVFDVVATSESDFELLSTILTDFRGLPVRILRR